MLSFFIWKKNLGTLNPKFTSVHSLLLCVTHGWSCLDFWVSQHNTTVHPDQLLRLFIITEKAKVRERKWDGVGIMKDKELELYKPRSISLTTDSTRGWVFQRIKRTIVGEEGRCRCYERQRVKQRVKVWGNWRLSHTRWNCRTRLDSSVSWT